MSVSHLTTNLIKTPMLASGGKPVYAAVVFAVAVVLRRSFQYKDSHIVYVDANKLDRG